MKVRDQILMGDGFDKNVAVKMPKVKKEDEFPLSDLAENLQPAKEEPLEAVSSEKEQEKVVPPLPKGRKESGPNLDILRLVDDLHAQLLTSSQTKRALEIDLASSRKTIHQLIQDNRELRDELQDLKEEMRTFKEIQVEKAYLKEENEDALEKIQQFQRELKDLKEALAQATQQREEALERVHGLESQMEQIELVRMREKLREREAAHFAEESRELRSRLEEAMVQNMELDRKYEEMRRSFGEVRESLTLLRDSCKANYYNLSENPD